MVEAKVQFDRLVGITLAVFKRLFPMGRHSLWYLIFHKVLCCGKGKKCLTAKGIYGIVDIHKTMARTVYTKHYIAKHNTFKDLKWIDSSSFFN